MIVGVREVGGHQESMPTESNKQDSYGQTENGEAAMDPEWVRTRSSAYMLWLIAWCFCGNLHNGRGCIF